tara:strand:- start:1289 stop:1678 length:390 start_codon:yes stop_codon:yes gene_type:complete
MTFTHEFEGIEVETAEGEFFYCYGNVDYELIDNSFDYAGTHCTHGLDGTHNPGDSAEVTQVHIDDVFDVNDKSIDLDEEVRGYLARLIQENLEEGDALINDAERQIEIAKEAQAADEYEDREYERKHGR